MNENKAISIIGLGKLGASMAAAYASRGFNVIGVDINPEAVRLMAEGKPPVLETNLEQYMSANKERIFATQDFQEAVAKSQITFIIVPTPSKENGDFSTDFAAAAVKKIGEALRQKDAFHLVVLTSTVTPGSSERDLIPVLEESSGKKLNMGFGFCYNPEFIALGSIIQNLLNPDFTLIGESDTRAGSLLEDFYNHICPGKPVKRMNVVNAEIAKISLNAYVTMKISYANMLAELCEKIPGGNVDVVTEAIGADSRIGHKYLKGALGFGGPCFPRDNRALMHVAKNLGVDLPLPQATDAINQRQAPRMLEHILTALPPGGSVGVLGLSYKPNTHVVEESQSLQICRELAARGIRVFAYDPQAMEQAKTHLGGAVIFTASAKECVALSDVAVIATPWEEFKDMSLFLGNQNNKKTIIIDCWRLLDMGAIRYITPGVHEENN